MQKENELAGGDEPGRDHDRNELKFKLAELGTASDLWIRASNPSGTRSQINPARFTSGIAKKDSSHAQPTAAYLRFNPGAPV